MLDTAGTNSPVPAPKKADQTKTAHSPTVKKAPHIPASANSSIPPAHIFRRPKCREIVPDSNATPTSTRFKKVVAICAASADVPGKASTTADTTGANPTIPIWNSEMHSIVRTSIFFCPICTGLPSFAPAEGHSRAPLLIIMASC